MPMPKLVPTLALPATIALAVPVLLSLSLISCEGTPPTDAALVGGNGPGGSVGAAGRGGAPAGRGGTGGGSDAASDGKPGRDAADAAGGSAGRDAADARSDSPGRDGTATADDASVVDAAIVVDAAMEWDAGSTAPPDAADVEASLPVDAALVVDAAAFVDVAVVDGAAPDAATAADAPPDAASADAPSPDAVAADSAPSDGPPANPALDLKCTVPVTFKNLAAGSPGALIFEREFPDVVAMMQAHARRVCTLLYRKPEEVRKVTQQGLTIESRTGVAFAVGGDITFSTDYIASYSNGKSREAITRELNGVLVHESTHVWQYNNGGGWLVEAMADYVRFRAGFDLLSRRRTGGNWDSPYTTGGFFIAWIEDTYDRDFGYKVNMGMKDPAFSYKALVEKVTGKPIDAAWAEYQADIK